MRVKICGITGIQDLHAAVEAGTDAVGFNFVAGPRKITTHQGEALMNALPPFVTPVALVKLGDEGINPEIASFLDRHRIADVQVYGDVTAPALAALKAAGLRPIVPVSVQTEAFTQTMDDLLSAMGPARPTAALLDAWHREHAGGTGTSFCWDWVAQARQVGRLDHWPAVILAGGLRPDNVAEAIRVVRPVAVDVSSGVEFPEKPGHKDPARMKAFVENAHGAESA